VDLEASLLCTARNRMHMLIKQKEKKEISITKFADDKGFKQEQIQNYGYVATQDFEFDP
jgi:hypothetical protein